MYVNIIVGVFHTSIKKCCALLKLLNVYTWNPGVARLVLLEVRSGFVIA